MWALDGNYSPDEKSPPYRCFLIRCWLSEAEEPGKPPAWRFGVQRAGVSGHQRCFARLVDVGTYLETELSLAAPSAQRQED